MNLLQLIQQVCDELAINRPTVIVGTNDPQTRQISALLYRLGNDLVRQFEWQRLNKEYILQTVAYTRTGTVTEGSSAITGISSTTGLSTQFGVSGLGIAPFAQITSVDNSNQVTLNMPATQSGTVDLQFSQVQYNLPHDYIKEIPQTEWDRTNRWPLMGPQSAQDWQSFKSGIVYAGPRERFRIVGNTYAINPPPPNGLVFGFEYISGAWVNSPSGVAQTAFQSDSDTFVFPDSLLVTGLKVQWKQSKGLDSSFDLAEFRALLENCKAQDKSFPKLSLSPMGQTVLMTTMNIPDGNWVG
jgi:hypothetical protein